MLNAYFGQIIPLMERAGGEVHQIVGDELMVVFGKDASVADHALRCGARGARASNALLRARRPTTTTGRSFRARRDRAATCTRVSSERPAGTASTAASATS